MPLRQVTVKVPATSANLGPGFDCLGMALGLYATVRIERWHESRIEVRGHGAGQVSFGKDNLIYRAVEQVYERLGRSPGSLRIRCRNAIPLRRGLGSSAAAVVGGAVAANALEGGPLDQNEVLRLCAALEGHPDNVAPALLGGLQIVVTAGEDIVATAVRVRGGLRGVLFVPEAEVPTKEARGLLSRAVPRADAVHNIGRVAMLVAALGQGRWDLLETATEDRLHQPQREAIIPGMGPIIRAALKAGAHGAWLSGAGPAILALVTDQARPVERAMAEAANRAEVSGATMNVRVGARGASVVRTA